MDQDHIFSDGEPEANFITPSLLGEKQNARITTFSPHPRKNTDVSTSISFQQFLSELIWTSPRKI